MRCISLLSGAVIIVREILTVEHYYYYDKPKVGLACACHTSET